MSVFAACDVDILYHMFLLLKQDMLFWEGYK